MAYIAEVVGRPGLYLIMSHGGEEIGSIEGMNEDWRWQIHGQSPVEETSLTRAKQAALNATRTMEGDLYASASFDIIAPASSGKNRFREALANVAATLRAWLGGKLLRALRR